MSLIGIIASSKLGFVPLSVDYLVVAGGASGSGGVGAGGGAGGLRSTVTATGGGGTLETALNISKGTKLYSYSRRGGLVAAQHKRRQGDSVFATITLLAVVEVAETSNTGAAGGSGGGGRF
jgi:hypothetical protein